MMNLLKKNFVLLLAVVLCLSLTACTGSSNDDLDTPVEGNDWRVTGVVRDGGMYYYADVTEDGQIIVVNTVLPHNLVDDAQTLEDYLTGCALYIL